MNKTYFIKCGGGAVLSQHPRFIIIAAAGERKLFIFRIPFQNAAAV